MDELAVAAAADPIEFRVRHLADPRAIAVLQAVARIGGWGKGTGTRRPRHRSVERI
jgi:hypothetical protein